MSEKFEVGDQVQLITGGPKMVVIMNDNIMGENYVHCVWYNGNSYSRSHFPAKIVNSVNSNMFAKVQPSSQFQNVQEHG